MENINGQTTLMKHIGNTLIEFIANGIYKEHHRPLQTGKEHEAVEADIWWKLCFCRHWQP